LNNLLARAEGGDRRNFNSDPTLMVLRRLTLVTVLALEGAVPLSAQYSAKTNVAHRGASAYAPEHTRAAYELAIAQGADYVEQDLQITRDGVLVCLHDLTLERTTNVEEVFPDRFRADGRRKTWPVSDFTLAEIRSLDAGSWFDPKFAGQRVLTWQDAIDLVRGRAGLFPETKAPEVYGSRGFDMEALVLASLRANGIDRPGADPRTPVIIQSFSAESLQKMRNLGTTLPLVLLIDALDPERGRLLSDEGLRKARAFADGIGPAKGLLLADPTLATRARAAGLSITPFTFRSAGQPSGRTVRDEMGQFLYDIGVDALFTDNPDEFPRR
jgi:glycerophosphoryl diester phosphodiesterase